MDFSEAPLGVRAAPARCAGLLLLYRSSAVGEDDRSWCMRWKRTTRVMMTRARARDRKKKKRPDDSPVWTWPWLPSPSFDRGPLDNRILLLRGRGEEKVQLRHCCSHRFRHVRRVLGIAAVHWHAASAWMWKKWFSARAGLSDSPPLAYSITR